MIAYEWFKFILKYGLFALCVLGVNKFRRSIILIVGEGDNDCPAVPVLLIVMILSQ